MAHRVAPTLHPVVQDVVRIVHEPSQEEGDDGGLFERALEQVRTHGGVIEHPAYSHAWRHFGLNKPPRFGGWVTAGWDGGWTCQVSQGNYGCQTDKPTWLYVAGIPLSSLPRLKRGKSESSIPWTTEGREGNTPYSGQVLPRSMRSLTPLPFRDVLLGIARRCPNSMRVVA